MDVFAVGEPELVDAARVRAGAVEKRDPLRVFRGRDVEQFDARLRVAGLLRLIGDRQDVADRLQRIGAHAVVRQVGARDDLQRLRVGDIDRGVVLRRALMRHPQDAPPVLGQLHRHALAHAAEPVERMVGKLPEIPDQRVAAGRALHCLSPLSSRVACVNPRNRFRSYPRSYFRAGVPVISATARTAARATRQTASPALPARTTTDPVLPPILWPSTPPPRRRGRKSRPARPGRHAGSPRARGSAPESRSGHTPSGSATCRCDSAWRHIAMAQR